LLVERSWVNHDIAKGNAAMNPLELAVGVRTVTQVADYFEELKKSATALTTRFTAQQRGYFTPDEEDEALALLVSYWQTRNALFDLICAMRFTAAEKTDAYPACFLVAYSAAVVLVDAARFIRDLVAERPVVRNKLNEQVAQFGIPAGTYDDIQKSLLSARNGWHLYHAMNYYREHRAELVRLAESMDARPLIDVIDRLQHRLDISITQFTRAKMRTRGSQITRRMASTLVGRALYGLQKLAGILVSEKYVRPGHVPQLPAVVRDELRQMLKPGDVLVTRKEYALTNYFLPGYWPHAALFLGTAAQIQALGIRDHENVKPRWDRLYPLAEREPGIVLESMKDGVHLRSLNSPFSSDSIVVLRPRLTTEEIAQGIARGLAHERKPYDFGFDFRRADRLVCTEVVYRSFDGMGSVRLPLIRRAGRPTLSGGDLLELTLDNQSFDPVAVYAPNLAPGISRQQAAHAVLAAAGKMQNE
jgi:hypothetical protein